MSSWLEWMSAHVGLSILFAFLGLVVLIGVRDVLQTRHAIRHNFPVLGRLRYILEALGPELRQYLVAHDKEEMPFNRNERRWVYATSKGENSNFGFGTTELLYGIGYPIIKHAAFPFPDHTAWHPPGDKSFCPSLKVMGDFHGRKRPYRPNSIINISAMSYGSLGKNAISALNIGAAESGCYHNTGEGGVSPYHKLGGDLMWQLGTGYFGARNPDGTFSLKACIAQIESTPSIRSIEIKLSQGAKPGKGGILPAAKVTPQIAEIRGIPVGESCLSPNVHSAFHSTDTLIDFVELIAKETGLPVGIKSAIGEIAFWEELAQRMKERNEGPDFIAVDGGEGGTGAAPLTFADHVALPFKVGFSRVYQVFQAAGVAQRVVWIGSGKVGFPDRAAVALTMGCDIIHVAREAMLAIGCIQAQKCHTGHCPAGVATHSRWFQAGLNVQDKSKRFARYVQGFRKEMLTLAHACGREHPGQLLGTDIEFSTGVNTFVTLDEVLGYRREAVGFTRLQDYVGT
jgi:glutamate synthase domain-containing protein 2